MQMKIDSKVFQVREGEEVDLNEWPTMADRGAAREVRS